MASAVGAGLQQYGEALAAGTAQVLANISEATGLELEEGVVDPGLARRAAAEGLGRRDDAGREGLRIVETVPGRARTSTSTTVPW